MGSSSVDMDLDDLTTVLNSDSASVMSKGLRRFARQIRRDHGLLALKGKGSTASSSIQKGTGSDADLEWPSRLQSRSESCVGEPDEDSDVPCDLDDARGRVSVEHRTRGAAMVDDGDEDEDEDGEVLEARGSEEEDDEEDEEEEDEESIGGGVGEGGGEEDEEGDEDKKEAEDEVGGDEAEEVEDDRDGEEEEEEEVSEEARDEREGALLAAASKGEASGLLGDYLRGSPHLNDLLAVWELDVRKATSAVAAAHTESLAAVLECLRVVMHIQLRGARNAREFEGKSASEASSGRPASGVVTGAGEGNGKGVESTGLALCRRLIRERMSQLQGQLSAGNDSGKAARGGKPQAGAKKDWNLGEAGRAATLRLLIAMARFHRHAAKELAGVFKFSHKGFMKMVSRRVGDSSDAEGVDGDEGAPRGKGKNKKRKLGGSMTDTGGASGVSGSVAAGRRDSGGRERDDTKHLSVALLCAFLESGDPHLQTLMISGTRGGSFGMVFRGYLWRDPPRTPLLVVETLHRMLHSRRVSRRSKAEFFSPPTLEHLRKVLDGAPAFLYEPLQSLLMALLCDPLISPFLGENPAAATSSSHRREDSGMDLAGHEEGESSSLVAAPALILSPRQLLAGITCLGAHEDPEQRSLLLSALRTCPALVGPYLRSIPADVLLARPSYQLLQTFSLLSTVLREAPVLPLAGRAYVSTTLGTFGYEAGSWVEAFILGKQGSNPSELLLAMVMPTALNKKELTKGVLSANPLLQATTMTLIADILDRTVRVARVAAAVPDAASLDSATNITKFVALVRERVPEVQTLLGLRDRLGGNSAGGAASVKSVKFSGSGAATDAGRDTDAAMKASPSTMSGHLDSSAQSDKWVFLRWRLLSLLERYAKVIPGAVESARFDFLKLLPTATSGGKANAGESKARSTIGGLASMHPLVQLATLRLLARERVVPATPWGGGGANAVRSGWLAERSTTGQSRSEGSSAPMAEDGTLSTPLGTVLLVALDSTAASTQAAARALAICALQSLGVVTVPKAPPGKELSLRRGNAQDDGSGDMETEAQVGGEAGEASVWMDLLTPDAVGSLVTLTRKASAEAHDLLTAGIRAAERGMRESPFLHPLSGVDDLDHSSDDSSPEAIGDWEVEFSPLTVAAVMTLAHSARNQKQDEAQGDNDGRIAENLGRGAPPSGSGKIGAESTRFLSVAITRVIHLHEDPKPFAGLCYSLLSGIDNANGFSTGSGVGSGNKREAGGGEDDRGVETAAPVTRACRGK